MGGGADDEVNHSCCSIRGAPPNTRIAPMGMGAVVWGATRLRFKVHPRFCGCAIVRDRCVGGSGIRAIPVGGYGPDWGGES